MNRPKLVSIVIPVLNEDENVGPLAEGLLRVFAGMPYEVEILFVDDGSSDGTAAVIAEAHAKDARIKLCLLSRTFGHQAALSAGLSIAAGDAVIVMDGDGQHPASIVPEMLSLWEQGAEVVNSIRVSHDGVGWLKTGVSRAFYRAFSDLSGIPLPAGSADFRLLDRRIVTVLNNLPERRRFIRGLVAWMGFQSAIVRYHAPRRKTGVSKFRLQQMLTLGIDGVTAFSSLPLLASLWLGVGVAGIGFLYLLYVIYVGMVLDIAVTGWTSMVCVMLVIGGIQLIVLGIMGLYIGRIFDEIKARPMFLIRRTLGIEK
jgi:dolichol-phosphate mannosyltransferase